MPLYTTYTDDNLVFVTEHSEATAMVVSNPEMLARFAAWAARVPAVRSSCSRTGDPAGVALPEGVRVMTLDALRAAGRAAIAAAPNRPDELRDLIDAQDVATLIYTSGTTGQPKGVMLTHENISSNVFAAYTGIRGMGHQDEVALTFLPMTHIYARMLSFADVAWGHQTFYSNPDLLVGHLAEVRPTIFATVPRVLEKVYDKVMLGVQQSEGAKHAIGTWAMGLATRVRHDATRRAGSARIKHALADKLVYSKLRERLGLTRVKVVSVGGAALRPDLSNSFAAWGIPTLQGYGLTETSPVITNSTPDANRRRHDGPAHRGRRGRIAEDGEILTRGPHVMKGYYKEPEKTAEVIDADGWFHTGDIGDVHARGLPQDHGPQEGALQALDGQVRHPAAHRERAHRARARRAGDGRRQQREVRDGPALPQRRGARALGQGPRRRGRRRGDGARTDACSPSSSRSSRDANAGMDHWMQIKRFRLCPEPMTVENGLLDAQDVGQALGRVEALRGRHPGDVHVRR